MSEPYPFESDDDIEIGELDLEDVDALGDERITVGELVGESESWRFGHVIVDEAQDLTPMQWRMVMRRVSGRSLTIVGDLAQRSVGPAQQWSDHLPAQLADVERLDLTINYRSPAEIHTLAVDVLAQFAPDVEPSRAIRSVGFDPAFRQVDDLFGGVADSVAALLREVRGQVAVISAEVGQLSELVERFDVDRLQLLAADEAKGLEFDAVVLVEPGSFLDRVGGHALLYIALTRATQRLHIVHHEPLPTVFSS